jgi:cation:H+ antiporter
MDKESFLRMINLVILAAGFILLIKSADWLIEGASGFARKLHVSDLAVGLTVVAFGTSTPELVVNIFASIHQHQDIAVGNVIGSNIFNVFLILGVTALIAPLSVQSSTVWKEIPFSLAAVVILFLLTRDIQAPEQGVLSRIDGTILLVLFVMFLLYVYRQLRIDSEEPGSSAVDMSGVKIVWLITIGIMGLVFGGRFVVAGAVQLAESMGASQKIIGLTLVAAGTSMPELMTSVVAALKKNDDIAVGNIIGSNIFNILLILGLSASIHPVVYNHLFDRDMAVLTAGTIFLFSAMFTGGKKRLDRWEGGLLFAAYAGYTFWLIIMEG